jgi:hypothetical protein
MKNRYIALLIVLLIFIIVTSACAQFDSIMSSVDPMYGVAAEEPIPSPTQILIDTATLAPPPTQIPSPTSPPTETVVPSPSPTDELSPTPEPTATITQPSCTNIAELDRHLNINEGSVLQPNTLYAKVWRIKNIGTCSWNTNYALTYSDGDESLNQADIPLSNEVQPGETIELRVNFTTPEKGNTYIGNWMLKSDTGLIFGVGSFADQPIVLNYVIPPQSNLPPSC